MAQKQRKKAVVRSVIEEATDGYRNFMLSCQQKLQAGEVPLLYIAWDNGGGYKDRIGFFGGFDRFDDSMRLHCGGTHGGHRIMPAAVERIVEIDRSRFRTLAVSTANKDHSGYVSGKEVSPREWLPSGT